MEAQVRTGGRRKARSFGKVKSSESGKYYKFSAPQKAKGFPVNGMKVCGGRDLVFSGGVLLSEDPKKGLVFFRGIPDDDPRSIKNDNDRECFFTLTAMDLKRITFVN